MKTVLKIVLAALGYVIGTMLSWWLTTLLHLPTPAPPPGASSALMVRNLVLCSPLLIASLVFLASGIGGTFLTRFGALFALFYVCVGLNTLIEASVFTSTMSPGLGAMILQFVLPCAVTAALLAKFFRSGEPVPSLPRFSGRQWSIRLLSAWLAYPVIYWGFGMCVAPFVLEHYRAGVAGLQIPGLGVVLRTEVLRSALYLVATVPVVLLWAGSRRRLFVSLGVAYAVTTGIFGLLQAYWFPTVLRLAHSIEITADSFAYAGMLVWLLTAKRSAAPRLSCMQAAASFKVE